MAKLFFIWILTCFIFSSSLFSQDLYDLGNITEIRLKFVEEDWEYPLHYYYSIGKGERNLGQAIINDETFDSVGVRFKGFSSYRKNFKKNPLNIKLDYVHKKAECQKYETLKLSNGNLDPSWLREVLAYQIARKYMVAPQSNYAKVFVNDKYYGLFGNTENVDSGFGERYFNAKKNTVIIKGNAPGGPFSGSRSSLEYLGNDSTLYMEAYELDGDYGWQALQELARALKYNPENIENILNMDAAIWMLAFNNVIVNLDSYSDFQQNYYLIQDKNGRLNFVPWDLNLAFDGLGKPSGVTMQYDYDPLAKMNDEKYPLINLVLKNPVYRKMYFAHCRTILEDNFMSGWYKKEADKHRALISEAVKLDSNWAFPYEAFEQNFTKTYVVNDPQPYPYPGIVELMEARVDYIKRHPEYKKTPPLIFNISTEINKDNNGELIVSAQTGNAQMAHIFYRYKKGDVFQKIKMVKNGDTYTAGLPFNAEKIQYYIFAENEGAAMFAPERAAHEYLVFPDKE